MPHLACSHSTSYFLALVCICYWISRCPQQCKVFSLQTAITYSTHLLRPHVLLAALCMQTRNPSKDLPIGIVGSLLACSALYAGLALTLCLMVRSLTMPAK